MSQPHLRAADTDRAAVASLLGQHMSAGRLTLEEFDERLSRAYAARTFGELDELTADLPAVDGGRPAVPAQRAASEQAPATGHGRWGHEDDVRSAWRSWFTTALVVITIWGVTSLASWDFLYFWPMWVIGPWGAVLLARTITGNRERDSEKPRQLGT
jgi:hypothetical protein